MRRVIEADESAGCLVKRHDQVAHCNGRSRVSDWRVSAGRRGRRRELGPLGADLRCERVIGQCFKRIGQTPVPLLLPCGCMRGESVSDVV